MFYRCCGNGMLLIQHDDIVTYSRSEYERRCNDDGNKACKATRTEFEEKVTLLRNFRRSSTRLMKLSPDFFGWPLSCESSQSITDHV